MSAGVQTAILLGILAGVTIGACIQAVAEVLRPALARRAAARIERQQRAALDAEIRRQAQHAAVS
jgi:hypothetical protein